jgi:hypothetical protein
MLITNFSAGELAETLFGRVDLGQYYNGVSHLENFDVIPTGGISRRHGFKRIAVKNSAGSSIPLGEGRIIPFILNRDESFLLFLSPKTGPSYPAMIRVFDRAGLLRGDVVASTPNVPLYETMEQINDVQYAQNYDKMVLVHEDYAPILIMLVGNNLFISKFSVLYGLDIKSTDGVDETPYSNKYDEDYHNYQYLNSPRNYPRSVTFFNGRVVFAGTKNNPQRIFASQVNNIQKFATYKLFLTEQRNYITVLGSIDSDDLSKIILKDTGEGIKFTEPLENYIVDSPFYPKSLGEVKVESLRGKILKLSRNASIESALSLKEQQDLENLIKSYTDLNNDKTPYTIGTSLFLVQDFMTGNWRVRTTTLKFYIGASEYQPRYEGEINFSEAAGKLDFDVARLVLNGSSYLFTYIKQIAENLTAFDITEEGVYDGFMYHAGGSYDEAAISNVASIWRIRILQAMRYDFRGEWYYNYPDIIKQQLLIRVGLSDEVYIPLYTKKPIEDYHPTPDDGFTFEIASDMSDSIKWLAQKKDLLVGTETGEWVIPAGVTATNVQAMLNSRYGSDKIQATAIGDAMCFFQSGKKALVEYYIPQQDNNFRANNMAMLSKNMLHESPAFDFDFISAPYTKIFVSREDGTMVCLLYERSTGTFAWGRITTGKEIEVVENGVKVKTRNRLIRSVATVPGLSGYDDVYLLVQQGDTFFLERYSERGRGLGDDEEEAVFLDSYQRYTGNRAGYNDNAVLYDETDNKVYPYNQGLIPDHVMWIGYPYESRVRSMPVLANDQMKQNNIKNLHIRFNNSFMPRVRSVSMSEGKERLGNTDSIGRPEPYSGVVQVPFPGVGDRDVFFELVHDKPTRCRVLAVNAEAK